MLLEVRRGVYGVVRCRRRVQRVCPCAHQHGYPHQPECLAVGLGGPVDCFHADDTLRRRHICPWVWFFDLGGLVFGFGFIIVIGVGGRSHTGDFVLGHCVVVAVLVRMWHFVGLSYYLNTLMDLRSSYLHLIRSQSS